jgi:hypothetical protein
MAILFSRAAKQPELIERIHDAGGVCLMCRRGSPHPIRITSVGDSSVGDFDGCDESVAPADPVGGFANGRSRLAGA